MENTGLKNFYAGIYKWMSVGIAISGLVAYYVFKNPEQFSFIFNSNAMFYGVIGIQLALMLLIQFLIKKLSPTVSGILFFLYAITTGLTTSIIFAIYNLKSIVIIFGVSFLIYLALAIFGYTTKKDFSPMGKFLFFGMIGIILASLINMYFQNSTFDIVISGISIFVFAGLTVYDNQAYKEIYEEVKDNEKEIDRYTILGALHMYINFIVIFQNLLSLFGERD